MGRSLEMRLFTLFLDEVGVPWRPLAERHRLPGHIPLQNSFLPTVPVLNFLNEVVLREDCADMSARALVDARGEIKRDLPVTQLEIDFLMAPSLYAGMQAYCAGFAKYWSRFQLWLRETEHHVWFCSGLPIAGSERGVEQQVQGRIIRLVGLIEKYLGVRWRPHALLLESALPSPLLAEVLDCPRIITNAGYSAVPIPVRLLASSGPACRGESIHTLCDPDSEAENWTLLRSLQAVLPEYVIENQPSIAQIADIAHVSSRTLQRELACQGMSFRELLDGARFTVARQKLAEPELKIEDIGAMLGYTQPTHFSRAFRRFAGQTPSQYREMLQARR